MSRPEISVAEDIAREAHAGQKDTVTGDPYIRHIERVVERVHEGAKPAAWLHDVLEDTLWKPADLLTAGVSPRTVAAVVWLTRDKQEETYADYINRIIRSGDPLAITIKIADLRDHLHPNCPESLRPRYEKALNRMTGEVPA